MTHRLRSVPFALLIPAIALLAGARPVSAHHAFAAEYDASLGKSARPLLPERERREHAQFFGPASVQREILDANFGSVIKAQPPHLVQIALKFTF